MVKPSGKTLAVRLTGEDVVKLEALYTRFGIDGNIDSNSFRKLLGALSSVAEPEARIPTDQESKDGETYESVQAERIPNDQLPVLNCPFAGPFKLGNQLWIFCDNTELRAKRGTNKVPLSACLQCDTRNRQSKQKQPQREAQALPAPTISSSCFSNLTFLRSSFTKARILIISERFDLLTTDLRQAIDWGLTHSDQLSYVDQMMSDKLREKLRKKTKE